MSAKDWGNFTGQTLFAVAGTKGLGELNAAFKSSTMLSKGTNLFHATSAGAAENILTKGIDIGFSKATSRFGKGFYMATSPSTSAAELAAQSSAVAATVQFSLKGGSFLNATSRVGNLFTKYTPKLLSSFAKALNKDGIIFNSQRSAGTNVVMFKNFNLLENGKILK